MIQALHYSHIPVDTWPVYSSAYKDKLIYNAGYN